MHSEFYNKLIARVVKLKQQAESSQERVTLFLGDLFLEMAPFLKLYPLYVSQYDAQMRALKEEKEKNQLFRTFLERQFKVGAFFFLGCPFLCLKKLNAGSERSIT